jgi:hypothetical protein
VEEGRHKHSISITDTIKKAKVKPEIIKDNYNINNWLVSQIKD